MLHSTGGLGEMLKHLISDIQEYSKILGLQQAEAPPHLADSCRNCLKPSHQIAKTSAKMAPAVMFFCPL